MEDENDNSSLGSIIEFFTDKNPFNSSLDPRKAFTKAKFERSQPYTFTERRKDLFNFFKGKKSAGLVDYLLLPAYALLLLASVLFLLLAFLTFLTDFPLFYIPLGAAAAVLFGAIAVTYLLVRAISHILSTFLTILSLPILGILHGLDIDYREELVEVLPKTTLVEGVDLRPHNESKVVETIDASKSKEMIDLINQTKNDFHEAIDVASNGDKVFDDELKKDQATINSLTEEEVLALFLKYTDMQANLNAKITENKENIKIGDPKSLTYNFACQVLANRRESVHFMIFVLVIKLAAFDKEKISSLDLAGIKSASKNYLSLQAKFSEIKQSCHKQDLSNERKEIIRSFHELLDTVLLTIESVLEEIKIREAMLNREQQINSEGNSPIQFSLGSSNLSLLADRSASDTQSTAAEEYSNSPSTPKK